MLSIIIPCFNHSKTLLRAVNSAESIRGMHEIIIVDDCSTDSSPELIASLCAERPHVRSFINEVNSGPGFSRNRGICESQGLFVSFLDADDEFINPAFYEESLAVMAQDASIRAVKANMEFFDPVKGWLLPSYDIRYVSVLMSACYPMVIDRELLLSTAGFPEDEVYRGPSGGEDVAFMQALIANCGPLGKVDTVSYRVWSQEGSHLDRFLATTRQSGSSFEFLGSSGVDNTKLEDAIDKFKNNFCAVCLKSRISASS